MKKAILILGNHRSGTSITTSLVNALGYTLGKSKMVPCDRNNPKGYFENNAVMKLNDTLLGTQKLTWHNIPCTPFVPTEESRTKCIHMIQDEFKDATTIAIKCPRILYLQDLYIECLRELGYQVAIVCVHRHSSEIIQSLSTRNNTISKDVYETLCKTQNTLMQYCYDTNTNVNIIDIHHKQIEMHPEESFVYLSNALGQGAYPEQKRVIDPAHYRSKSKRDNECEINYTTYDDTYNAIATQSNDANVLYVIKHTGKMNPEINKLNRLTIQGYDVFITECVM